MDPLSVLALASSLAKIVSSLVGTAHKASSEGRDLTPEEVQEVEMLSKDSGQQLDEARQRWLDRQRNQ